MKILEIALNDFKVIAKDKSSLISLILMPFIIFSILGMVFGDVGIGGFQPIKVAVFSEDKDFETQGIVDDSQVAEGKFNMGKVLIEEVLKSEDLSDTIKLIEVNSKEEGQEIVREKKAAAFIYVPKSFTTQYIMGKNSKINIYGDSSRLYSPRIIDSIVKSFADHLDAVTITMKGLNSTAKKFNIDSEVLKAEIDKVFENSDLISEVNIIENSVDKKKSISGMGYYAAVITVMFVLFSGQDGAQRYIGDKRNQTAYRILSSPISPAEYLIGKLLGIVLIVMAQIIVLIILSSLIFNVAWGSVIAVLAMTIALAICVGCISLMVGSIAVDNEAALRLYNMLIWIFSFLAGTFIPSSSLPNFITKLGKFTPNGQAATGYIKIMQGFDILHWYSHAIILIAIGFIFFMLAIQVNKGRKRLA